MPTFWNTGVGAVYNQGERVDWTIEDPKADRKYGGFNHGTTKSMENYIIPWCSDSSEVLKKAWIFHDVRPELTNETTKKFWFWQSGVRPWWIYYHIYTGGFSSQLFQAAPAATAKEMESCNLHFFDTAFTVVYAH
jgi:hypothetical protein